MAQTEDRGREAESPRYWLRVYGYPAEVGEEVISFADFFDPASGPLTGDPSKHLRTGDVILYYADGPASLFGVGTVELVAPIPPPAPRGREQSEGVSASLVPRWRLTVKPQAVIRKINKAAHAAGLEPPSGWHFLRAVRHYTFIRLPDADGPYLVEQVRSRASTRGE